MFVATHSRDRLREMILAGSKAEGSAIAKGKTMRKVLALSFATLGLVAPGASMAQSFDGSTLNYQYYFPNITTPYANADNGSFIVGPGTEVTNIADNRGTMDIGGTNIFIDYTSQSGWTSSSFNGWILSDQTNSLSSILGVSINPATNMAGFSLANLSWTADSITTNWAGLAFDSNTVVSLDVAFSPNTGAVPEPSAWAMMLIGFGFVGGAMRARRRQKLAVSYA